MKKLDLYLIKGFIGPFIVVFFVVLFALIMQNFWLYMDDILGKGLSFWVIAQYLFNFAIILSPLALPLALMLTGIMNFGALGEHFELAAIKSAGVSLVRFMRPLIFFSLIVGTLSFLTNNYIMPVMNLKTYSLLYDMRKKKPALNLEEGVFNKLFDGFSIRIGKKSENGVDIKDVLIYEHNNDNFNRTVTIADSGKILPSADNKYLVFTLYNGCRYEEGVDPVEQQLTRLEFETWDKVFALSQFDFQRTEEDLFKNNEKMMNIGQLYTLIDSMNRKMNTTILTSRKQLGKYLSIFDTTDNLTSRLLDNSAEMITYDNFYLESLPDSVKGPIVNYMDGHIRASKSFLFNAVNEVEFSTKRKTRLSVEMHGKFSMAFACLVLFLIGAPLGGIIRKGGIGMPLVIGIVFFVIYFLVSSTGQKLASEGKVPVWFGMWLSSIILLPIAFIIIYQAKNDSKLVSKETYLRFFRKIGKMFKRK